jgi:hypothetical protein
MVLLIYLDAPFDFCAVLCLLAYLVMEFAAHEGRLPWDSS